jgi:hypothetical protein
MMYYQDNADGISALTTGNYPAGTDGEPDMDNAMPRIPGARS